jgi:Aerobic-type carbon monoxide dehydrogenase, middle subunit CoxM/CutM homologs
MGRSLEYLKPTSVSEACAVLQEYGEETTIIAGGQSLVPMMHLGLVKPRYVVSLAGIADLRGVEEISGAELRIGALMTHREVIRSGLVGQNCGVLAEAEALVGSQAVRNAGTLGGDLCHNEMGSDPGAVLLCLGAKAEIMSVDGMRFVPLSEFFADFFQTILGPGEVLSGVRIPDIPAGAGAAYLKLSRRVCDLAIVGVCAIVVRDGGDGTCTYARLGLNGVGPVPLRAVKAEEVLLGQPLTAETMRASAGVAMDEVAPISDASASAAYRKEMVRVFVQRALEEATRRAGAIL